MTSIGALSPLTGFMGKDDYWSVLESMRLPSGLPWPFPIVCPVPKEVAEKLPSSGPVALLAPDGNAVALLELTGVFEGNKKMEAQSVYRT